LHDQEGLPPRPHTAGQEDQKSTVLGRAVDTRHTALEHYELLTQQSVLRDEVFPAPRQVRQRAHDEACGRGCSRSQQATLDRLQETLATLM
jgi:hypothetical protein